MDFNMYTHPKFTDVRLQILTRFWIREKKVFDCKVVWWHKRGWELCHPYRMRITAKKMRELESV